MFSIIDYRMQLACLAVLFFISFLFFSVRHKASKINKLYSAVLVTTIVHLFFDMWSFYTVNHLDTVPPFMNRIAHQGYIAGIVTMAYLLYRYVLMLIYQESDTVISVPKCVHAFLIATFLGVLFLPIRYISHPVSNYSMGPMAYLAYISIIVYISLIAYQIYRHRIKLLYKTKLAITISFGVTSLCLIYQAIYPYSLISGIGFTIITLAFYLTIENPDATLVELLKEEKIKSDAANRAKSAFLANTSHEIRTPINTILGMNEMILRECRDPEIYHYSKNVESSANALLSIINDILDIARIENGKMEIIPVEYDMCSLLNDINNMIGLKAQGKGLDFSMTIQEDLPSRLLGDDIRIRQILINLLSNAVKYTPSGSVELRITSDSRSTNSVELHCEVIDTGIGIKEEDLNKLTHAFSRIEEERNRNIEGTGLGISICSNLLSLMDSKLQIISTYGKGSNFHFVLSQEIVDTTPVGNIQERLSSCCNEENGCSHLGNGYQVKFIAENAHVLVVDDNAMNRKVFCDLLKRTKLKISEAGNGFECLRLIKDTHYDLIFMDHMMPDLDGVQTLHMMRQTESLCMDTPVIILTANAVAGAKERYLAEGFSAFLSKPIIPNKLESLIMELLPSHLFRNPTEEELQNSNTLSDEDTSAESILPIIDGLDWEYAKLHFASISAIFDSLRFFANTVEHEADSLQSLYEEQNFKDYCTLVHSMKNEAATIGIFPLAGLAKTLEDAARENDITLLTHLTPVFLKKWRSYKNVIQTAIYETEAEESSFVQNIEIEKEPLTQDTFLSLAQMLEHAADNLDMEGMDYAISLFESFQITPALEPLYLQLKSASYEFDIENVKSTLNSIKKLDW